MLFTNCVTPLIHKQEINTLSTSTERIKRTHINTHTYRTVFVLSDSPLKVVRLCSWSALSTRLCPQSTHMHKHKHTHTIAESWESKLWCDYIFFKDCLLLLFKLCVFRRVFKWDCDAGSEGTIQTDARPDEGVSFCLNIPPARALTRPPPQSLMDACELYVPFLNVRIVTKHFLHETTRPPLKKTCNIKSRFFLPGPFFPFLSLTDPSTRKCLSYEVSDKDQ